MFFELHQVSGALFLIMYFVSDQYCYKRQAERQIHLACFCVYIVTHVTLVTTKMEEEPVMTMSA